MDLLTDLRDLFPPRPEHPSQLPHKDMGDCRVLEVFEALRKPGADGWMLAAFKEPSPGPVTAEEQHWLRQCAAQMLQANGHELKGDMTAYLFGQVFVGGRWQRVYVGEVWVGMEARH